MKTRERPAPHTAATPVASSFSVATLRFSSTYIYIYIYTHIYYLFICLLMFIIGSDRPLALQRRPRLLLLRGGAAGAALAPGAAELGVYENVYVYLYVCMYIYIYMYIYVYICRYVYVYM